MSLASIVSSRSIRRPSPCCHASWIAPTASRPTAHREVGIRLFALQGGSARRSIQCLWKYRAINTACWRFRTCGGEPPPPGLGPDALPQSRHSFESQHTSTQEPFVTNAAPRRNSSRRAECVLSLRRAQRSAVWTNLPLPPSNILPFIEHFCPFTLRDGTATV